MKIRRSYSLLALALMLGVAISSCQKDPKFTSTVVDGPKPASAFSYAASSGNALSISFTSTSTNAQSYFWQFGDGTTSTDAAPTHVYSAPAIYTVTLRVVSLAGNPSNSSQPVTAIPPATSVFSVASQFELGFTFANTSTAVASVSWDFGDNSTSTALNPQHRYSAAGTYNVKLTVTGLLGDVISSTQSINVANNNLISGGFEAGTSSKWLVYSSQSGMPPIFGYTGDGPAGGYDAALRFPSFSNSGGLNELIYQPVQVVAGQQYKLSALVKLPAGGKNDYLQFYISKNPNTWIESTTDPNANFFLALNNYHAWGASSNSTTAVNGDMYAATLGNGQYGLGVATGGIYTATITGTVYIGIQAGVYNGTSNGDFLIDNVSFTKIN